MVVALAANAAVIGRINGPDGFYALLENVPEECPMPGAAVIAIYNPDGTKAREGCWKGVGEVVRVLFKGGGQFEFQASEVKWGEK